MIYISSVGMVCAVGLTAEAACAAIRAGIAGFQRTKHRDESRYSVVGAPVPGLSAQLRGQDRLVQMLSMSIEECLRDRDLPGSSEIPLIVGLAETGRPGVRAGGAGAVLRGVQETLGMNFHSSLSRTVESGHASGFEAMQLAREYLQAGAAPACIVSGVDSYLENETLAWLGRHSRLKTPKNSDGVIPGEGSGSVLVWPSPEECGPLATDIMGLGFAIERASILTEEPMLGLGLTAAARNALADAGIDIQDVDFRMADVTGESYGFREQALLLGRLLKSRREKMPLWDCAGSIGDTGAAAGLCQLVIAHVAFMKGYAAGERVLCCTSAVPGERAAAVIRSRQTNGH